MTAGQSINGDTKARLILAGERLFARDGIHRALIREINELAGQRNSSALHYHFGSRAGLVDAILLEHQLALDLQIEARLDELEARGDAISVRDVVEASVRANTTELTTDRGRCFLQIVPQMIHRLSDSLRRGEMRPVTPQSRRVLNLLASTMEDLPEAVRRERLASFTVVLTSLLADRAKHVDDNREPALDPEQYIDVLCDTIAAMLMAPSSVVDRGLAD